MPSRSADGESGWAPDISELAGAARPCDRSTIEVSPWRVHSLPLRQGGSIRAHQFGASCVPMAHLRAPVQFVGDQMRRCRENEKKEFLRWCLQRVHGYRQGPCSQCVQAWGSKVRIVRFLCDVTVFRFCCPHFIFKRFQNHCSRDRLSFE